MKKIWHFLTGSESDKIIEKVSNGLDKITYTKQEKAEVSLKLKEIALETLRARLNLSSYTRRLLAWSIMGVFLFFVIITGFLILCDAPQKSEQIIELLDKTKLNSLAVSVSALYFGSYGLNNIIKSVKNEKK